MKTVATLNLTFLGFDSWDRPVYEDEHENLYCDVDPRPSREPDICTKQGNLFNGEPCSHIDPETHVVFMPKRATW